ncbi:hypothetical protein C1J03_10290 [Sulfitobacter sp. SK012]|nr:hypothetical protein C1J03_10290 [Sulfitobacter sp. SK012]
MLADAVTQLSETISCAAETKAAVGAIRSKLDRSHDRVADIAAVRSWYLRSTYVNQTGAYSVNFATIFDPKNLATGLINLPATE